MIIEETRDNHNPHTYINAELARYPQWVAWKYGLPDKTGKVSKLPINPNTGLLAKPNKPSTWATYEQAIAAKDEHGLAGIGFVFSQDDALCGVDLDDCIVDGELAAWAEDIVKSLDSYTEISPSGTGLKIWIRASKRGPRCKARLGTGSIEIYDHNRYFTYTGKSYHDRPIRDAQEALDTLYAHLFPATPYKPTSCASGDVEQVLEIDDELVLVRARAAKNGAKFESLYDRPGADDYSRADLALAQLLAFWCGKDAEQMDRLFRASARMRDKWDEVHYSDGRSYGEGTIDKAIATCTRTYTPKADVTSAIKAELEKLEGLAYELPWAGRRGPTMRAAFAALIYTGMVGGWDEGEGVAVRVSVRRLCEVAGITSLVTMVKALEALEEDGLIAVIERGNKDTEIPNTYVLLTSTTVSCNIYKPCVNTMLHLTVAALLIRIRENGIHRPAGEKLVRSMDCGRVVSHVKYWDDRPPTVSGSIGKDGALVLEKVLLAGSMTVKALATALGAKRVNNTRKRVQRVVDAGLLLIHGEDVYVPDDLERRLEEHLGATGSNLAAYRQRVRHYEDRAKVDRAPTDAELAEASEAVLGELQRIAEADGITNELQTYNEEFEVFTPQDELQQPIPDNVVPIKEEEHSLACECIDCSIPMPKYARPYDGSVYTPKPKVEVAA